MTRKILYILILLGGLLMASVPQVPAVRQLSSIGPKGGCTLAVELRPGEIDIANQFHLRCRVTLPPDATLKALSLPQDGLKNIVQIGGVKELPAEILKDRGCILIRDYCLDAQLPDKELDFEIPAIKATIQLSDGKTVVLESEGMPLSIEVPTAEELQGLAIDSTQSPATSLKTPAERRRDMATWCCIFLGSLILLALFIMYIRRRQKKKRMEMPAPSPYEIALGRLESLLKQALPDAGEYKRYYTGISAILREYIEGRYQVNAPTQTTEEFLHSLTDRQIPELKDFRGILQAFLTECDMVKFAEQQPTGDQSVHLAKTCRQFLDTTRPPEPQFQVNHNKL